MWCLDSVVYFESIQPSEAFLIECAVVSRGLHMCLSSVHANGAPLRHPS